MRLRRARTCSFCGRTEHEVQRLIAGPRVLICDACVARCNEILAQHPVEPARAGAAGGAAPGPSPPLPEPRRRWRLRG